MQIHLLFIRVRMTITYMKLFKPNANKMYTYEYVTHKFNQDLIDYKNRDLVINETKDIRNILYVKAFANNDDFEDFNLVSEK